MTTIRQLLNQKGRDTWSTLPDATVLDAAAKMAEKNIGSLVVMDGGTFVGIITERHIARNTALMGPTSPVTLVRDVMETRVLVARPEHSVEQCMALLTERRVAHLPVESMQTRGDWLPVELGFGLTERGWAGAEAGVACEAGGGAASRRDDRDRGRAH
jgi:predicted transcriptional regulator